jgi:hypothetical protein
MVNIIKSKKFQNVIESAGLISDLEARTGAGISWQSLPAMATFTIRVDANNPGRENWPAGFAAVRPCWNLAVRPEPGKSFVQFGSSRPTEVLQFLLGRAGEKNHAWEMVFIFAAKTAKPMARRIYALKPLKAARLRTA